MAKVEEATKPPRTTFKADSLRLIFKRGLSGKRFWPSGQMLNVKKQHPHPDSNQAHSLAAEKIFEATAGSEARKRVEKNKATDWFDWIKVHGDLCLDLREAVWITGCLTELEQFDLKMDPKYSGCLNQTLSTRSDSPLWL